MTPTTAPLDLPFITYARWQMTLGERFAIEGLLGHLQPALSIETGTAQGGSLRRLALHSGEVHAFDILPEVKELEAEFDNVTIHIGDSTTVLPEVMRTLAAQGQHVDFALIDGDHTPAGVQRDILAVLNSDACTRTVVVFHDTANDDVRAGLDALDLPNHPKVALCMLDFVPGYLVVEDHPQYSHAAWNGLGLVILDDARGAATAVTMDDRYSSADVIQRARRSYQSA